MQLQANVFDVWAFRRTAGGAEYLLLHTSQRKADRWFSGGRFWQVPSNQFGVTERASDAIGRLMQRVGATLAGVWAGEHAYTIYNRRFEAIQLITVFAAEVAGGEIRLDPDEHAEYRWCPYEEAQRLVAYRGLKDGLASVRDYVTERTPPLAELRLA
jgi:hypothetical protein